MTPSTSIAHRTSLASSFAATAAKGVGQGLGRGASVRGARAEWDLSAAYDSPEKAIAAARAAAGLGPVDDDDENKERDDGDVKTEKDVVEGDKSDVSKCGILSLLFFMFSGVALL